MSLQSVTAAAKGYEDAYAALRASVVEAQDAGVPDAAIARAANVTRQTVRRWTGKA